MAITSRAALKAQFRTGGIPTAQGFFNLIDSILVKRDDVFFGKWQPGISYHEDDVVIYKNGLYSCVLDNTDPCGCDDTVVNQEPGTLPPAEQGFCSVLPPDQDKAHWRLLELEIADEDWGIIRALQEGAPDIMYAKVFGKIGMGTQEPQARVHIHDAEGSGDFLFNPDHATAPEFVIQRSGEGARLLSQKVEDDQAKFTTDTTGFLFQQVATPQSVPDAPELQMAQMAQMAQVAQVAQAIPTQSVFITAPDNKAAIGVGTLQPEAAVDVHNQPAARLLLNPMQSGAPEIMWMYKGAYHQHNSLLVTVNETNTQLTTNAPEGFYFRKGLADCRTYAKSKEDPGQTLVVIKPNNKVGIGTENPRTHLETTDGEKGTFLMSLEEINPAFSVINLRPTGGKSNYLAIGADNDQGVLITDSKQGFVFRRGGEYGVNDNEINLNQQDADDLLTIRPNGKVGIGMLPADYELDLHGNARMFTLYLDTDLKKTKEVKPLENVLPKIEKLTPVSFRWNTKRTNCADDYDQYGFEPRELEEFFPGLVKTCGDNKSVAYPNMVAILTKAIKEQQAIIKDLQTRVAHLEASGPAEKI